MFTVHKNSLLVYKLIRIMKVALTFCYGCTINAILCLLKREILCGLATKEKHDNDGHSVCVALRNVLILRDIIHSLLTVVEQLRDEDLFTV